MSFDTTAMMGGVLLWLDYDDDDWLDLFVVNSHADVDIVPSDPRGASLVAALFHNVGGRFEDVTPHAEPTFRFAGTAASPPTSTSTVTPIST